MSKINLSEKSAKKHIILCQNLMSTYQNKQHFIMVLCVFCCCQILKSSGFYYIIQKRNPPPPPSKKFGFKTLKPDFIWVMTMLNKIRVLTNPALI